jgi:predicted nucleotidyltransferase
MIDLVRHKREDLIQLCRRYFVKRLELFGSATGSHFVDGKSDLDFLVVFEATTPAQHAERYFGLLASLQDLFERPVDLVELGAIRNPYFLEGIRDTRRDVYAN